jgi:hypothetical protein
VYVSRNDLPAHESWFVRSSRNPIRGARGNFVRVTLPRAGRLTGAEALIPVAWWRTRFVALEQPGGLLSPETETVTRVTLIRTEFGFVSVSAIAVVAPGTSPLTSPEIRNGIDGAGLLGGGGGGGGDE